MSNKKPSSIEWLEEQIKDIFYVAEASEMSKKFKSVYEQAKAMHKEEVKDAYREGRSDQQSNETFYNRNAELYFNEKFGGNNETH